jgi:transposase-like protein
MMSPVTRVSKPRVKQSTMTFWLYLRFTLSDRDVAELLAERGLDISHETFRHWVLKLGPTFARTPRRPRPSVLVTDKLPSDGAADGS